MSLIGELYAEKPKDYLNEKAIVHNLFLMRAVMRTIAIHKADRSFRGYYYLYNAIPGDGDSGQYEFHPTNAFPIDVYANSETDWKMVEKLVIKEIHDADIGFRSFEVKVIEKLVQQRVQDKHVSPILGRKKYHTVTVREHWLWMKAEW